jgi:hypothetical protein
LPAQPRNARAHLLLGSKRPHHRHTTRTLPRVGIESSG